MKLDLRPWTHRRIEANLVLEGVIEPDSTTTYRNLLRRLRRQEDSQVTVFDVGANIGYYALLAANELADDARIVAIEPEPENASLLRENVGLNEYSQVDVLEMGIGDESGTSNLKISDVSSEHSFVDGDSSNKDAQSIAVDTTTLDSVIKREIGSENSVVVVRMDIEGYEGRAFRGMEDFLANDQTAILFVEIHDMDQVDRDEIIDIIVSSGFNIEFVSQDGGESVVTNFSIRELKQISSNIHIFATRGVRSA